MATPTTEIINNGASLKIVQDGYPRNILKMQVKEVSVINNTVIKIDIGQGALSNIFFDFSEVANPETANPYALVEAINLMLQTNANISGVATERNQEIEISELLNIKTNQLLSAPQISDESNPRTIYRGFAAPGSITSVAVWAIQKIENNGGVISYLWAGGNRNFDKVWNDRKTLQYS